MEDTEWNVCGVLTDQMRRARMERLMTDKMLRIEEVMEITRLSRATIYRKMSKGQFPKPLKLGDRAVRWRQSEIEAWLASLPRAMG